MTYKIIVTVTAKSSTYKVSWDLKATDVVFIFTHAGGQHRLL